MMKTAYRYILLIAVVSVLVPKQKMYAQTSELQQTVTVFERSVDCSENVRLESDNSPVNILDEQYYPYLRNLDCLKNKHLAKKLGFTSAFKNNHSGNNTHFILTGSGYKMDMEAMYDKDGDLVESLLRLRDIRIPVAIRQYIYSDQFDGWTMTGNKKIVRDFDPFQTEYEIIMTNGEDERVLHFKEYGNIITYLEN